MNTFVRMLFALFIINFLFALTLNAQKKPGVISPIFDSQQLSISKADQTKQASLTIPARSNTVSTAASASLAGGNRLVAMQYTNGGWGWPLTAPPTYGNIHGPIAMGLAQAYQQTGITSQKTGLTNAGTFLLAKTNNFSPSDGYLAAQLDKVLGGTTYSSYVKTNFYDKLAAGTYDRNGLGTLYTTASYVTLIRTSRTAPIANIAAWDLGMGLVGAAMCGAGTSDWIAGVKAEIDELSSADYYDVIGLAGAVYGLAFVNEDFDPIAGSHSAASNLNDLAAILAGYQISLGGFTWNSAYVSSGNETNQETGYAILALNEINRTAYLSNILGAADYLMSVQLGSGGWDNYPGDPDGENNEITGEALWGISIAYPPPVHNITKDVYYPTIQGASTDASAGNTIEVAAGTFNERVTITKSLTLTGAGETITILDGTGLGSPGSGITISSGVLNVTIKDLTVKNYLGTNPNSYAGIYAVGSNNGIIVQNVTLKDNVGGAGFYANGPINGVTLDNLDVSGHTNAFGAARGIVIWNGLKENISITNCDVYNNNCCGIELQDGTASGVTLSNNTVHDNGDNGIGVVGLQGPGENLINLNTLTNNGRFGMEIKNPNGSGATSGAGRIVVENNIVSRTVAIVDARDIVGIAAFRRGVLAGNVEIPTGVVIQNNTVSGYVQPSTSDGFGIVAEGMNHLVTGNTVSGCDVGIQRQYGHTPYAPFPPSVDGNQADLADTYFGRGNSPMSCGITLSGNILTNTINTRDVGAGIDAGIVTNTNSAESFCSIQSAINDAQTLNGHTIEVQPGTFNEQVLVNKSLTIKGVGASQPTVDFTGTPSGKLTLFDISADAVTVENMHFNVDLSKLKSAIIASAAGIDNITIEDNVIDAYGTPLSGLYGDRNAVSINYGGPTNYRVATGGVNSITFQDNTVNGALPLSFFRAGVAADEAGGTFSGNTLQTINHDILVRFGSNGNIDVTGNFLNGGGVELDDMNAGAGILTVSGNIFNALFANSSAPGSAVLRLQNNYNAKTTLVSGNTFTDHQWAVALSNYNTVTLDNNTFTPLAASTVYHHVAINTKAISTNSASIVQVLLGATLTNNTFNGSGTPGGTALSFHNHDIDAATFGSFTIGTSGNENNFNNGIGNFILFDNQTGTSSGSTFPAYTALIGTGAGALTTMGPWAIDLNGRNNKFDVGTGLKLPAAMTYTERTTLETNLMHKPDDGTLGQIFYFDPVHNITQNTYHTTIQDGINSAAAGDTLEVATGIYYETVNVNKRLVIIGAGSGSSPATNTVISGPGSGTGFTMVAGASASQRMVIKNLYVTNFFTGFAPLSFTTLDNVTTEFNVAGGRGIELGNLQDLVLNSCKSNNNSVGMRAGTAADIDLVTITNCQFNGNTQGWFIAKASGADLSDFSNVTVTGTTFNNNLQKGIYVEKLSDALFDGITVTNSGTDPLYGFNNGIDINLKYQAYQNITIQNSSITGSGVYGTASLASFPAAVTIKARDDSPSYNTDPASLNNVQILNSTVSGPENAIRFGEAGKTNTGPTGVVVYNCSIIGSNTAGTTGYGIFNASATTSTATGNFWGTLHGPSDAGGSLEVPRSPVPSVTAAKNAVPAPGLGSKVTDNNVLYFPWNGPGNAGANGGGIWAGGYVNPVSNDVFAGIDAAAIDGIDALDVVAPPPPPSDYLYLYFRTDPGQPIENYSIDVKKDEASLATVAKVWDFKAITDHTSEVVTIDFPDAGLPTGFKPTIYDLTTGAYQNLRENASLTYTSPPTETAYSFRLLMGDSTKPAVTVGAPNGGEFLIVGTPYNITWTSSDGSGVLRHYIYYSLTGGAPYTLIDSTNGNVYTLAWTPLTAASTASVKVIARDSVMNEEYDISNNTFAILTSANIPYTAVAGWNLVSPPMLQGDMSPNGIFGDDYGATPYYVFQFSPSLGYTVPSSLAMGQGYWLGSNSAMVIDAAGTPLSSASSVLATGFNIIGNPFAEPLAKADLRFSNGGPPLNMSDAALAGWISNVLYGYTGGGYFFENTTLAVWNGYWIPALVPGITVQYTPTVVVPTPKAAPEPFTSTQWNVEIAASLVVDDQTYRDEIASFGVHPDATTGYDRLYDAPRPPRSPAAQFVEINFASIGKGFPELFSSSLARDFTSPEQAQWKFTVTTSRSGEVTLRWDNSLLAVLPADVNVMLKEVDGKTTVDMKTASSYSYKQSGTTRQFVVNGIDEPLPTSFLLSQNYPNPFNPSTVISYALPQNAQVKIEVYDFLGREVTTLVDKKMEAGYHEARFEAGNASTGLYFYRLTATAENGSRFTDMKKMMLVK